MDDVAVRVERPSDRSAVDEVVEAAFASKAVADLVTAIRASEYAIPDLALVAERHGRVVGYVVVSHAEVLVGERRRRIAMLSPLAVAPTDQGRGIGSLLVRTVTARAAARRTGRRAGGSAPVGR